MKFGAKAVQNLGNSFFQKCHEAYQIDQPNVLNTRMFVVGTKIWSPNLVTKMGPNWPAGFRRCSPPPPPPPLHPSLLMVTGPPLYEQSPRNLWSNPSLSSGSSSLSLLPISPLFLANPPLCLWSI